MTIRLRILTTMNVRRELKSLTTGLSKTLAQIIAISTKFPTKYTQTHNLSLLNYPMVRLRTSHQYGKNCMYYNIVVQFQIRKVRLFIEFH